MRAGSALRRKAGHWRCDIRRDRLREHVNGLTHTSAGILTGNDALHTQETNDRAGDN